ncbi:MAG: 8-oxo-dGTP diphosphatase [Defluviitaleaceae bacterium]|nr:8-oxo-dGTP diphosphatase [Defluviitaleaceae bacterium]
MLLATLCYIEKQDKYLMLHRTKKENDIHEGLYVGLGGKFEAGESPEDCVIREVFEESGLRIKNPKLRGFMTFPNFGNGDDWYVFLFTATEFNGHIKHCNEGDLVWIKKNELSNLPMHEGDRYFLDWIEKNNGVFSAKFIYENGALKNYNFIQYK